MTIKREPRHHGKYRNLFEWLLKQQGPSMTVSITKVEEVLGFPLPPSSRRHLPHWYGFKGSAVARAIIDAGWRSTDANLTAERVTFVKEG